MFEDDRYLTADPLLRMAAGTIFSSMLQVGIDLDVFAKLKGKAVPVDELGALWGMPSASARVLAQYLTHMGALEYRDGQVANAPLSEAYLSGDTWTQGRLVFYRPAAGGSGRGSAGQCFARLDARDQPRHSRQGVRGAGGGRRRSGQGVLFGG